MSELAEKIYEAVARQVEDTECLSKQRTVEDVDAIITAVAICERLIPSETPKAAPTSDLFEAGGKIAELVWMKRILELYRLPGAK